MMNPYFHRNEISLLLRDEDLVGYLHSYVILTQICTACSRLIVNIIFQTSDSVEEHDMIA